MSIEDNKLLARRYIEEAVGRGDKSVLADLMTADATSFHTRYQSAASAEEGRIQAEKTLRTGLPDLQVAVDELIAEADRVVALWHYTGTHLGEIWDVPATGRRLKVDNITLFRFRDGRIAHTTTLADRMSVAVQIGSVGNYAPVIAAAAHAASQ